MHQPLGDRAVRELDDREHGACAAAGLEAVRRAGRESDEVARTDAPRVDTARERESADAGVPTVRPPADSVPSRPRANAYAVGSCCQTSSRVLSASDMNLPE